MAKIFSDVNRIKIVGLLYHHQSLCVCELCDTLNLSQPLVSRHLKLMKEAGLLQTKKEGKWVIYFLNPYHNAHCFIEDISKQVHTLPQIVSCDYK